MKVHVIWKRSVPRPRGAPGARSEPPAMEPPPPAMVDIHSHFLWGLDDGSRDLEETLAMLSMAAESGTTDIVATPHANFQYPFDPKVIAERIEQLKARPDLPLRIHSGCDFRLNFGNIREALLTPHKFTINGLSYLLVEFADVVIPPTIEEILQRFLAQGITPIISHPERNPILQQSTQRLKQWVSMGCLLQITAQSLSGEFGKIARRTAWDLVRAGLVHVVASDAHDTIQRTPRLDTAWHLLKRESGENLARKLLIDHPTAIIQGQPLPQYAVPSESLNTRDASQS